MKNVEYKRLTPAQWGVLILFAAAFIVMFIFNCMTPLISDDYTYLMIYPTTEPVSSLGDVFISQFHHYQLLNGRAPAHTLAQTFLWLPKIVFNLLNAAMFCIGSWAVAKLAVGRRYVSPFCLLAALGLLVHMNPCFGAVNLWLTGSCGYSWTLCFGLLFLLAYRFELDGSVQHSRWMAAGMFFLGVLAGWGNENISGAVILCAVIFIVLHRIFNKKISLWAVSGLGGSIVGFLMLMLSPGQWIRMDNMSTDTRDFLTIFLDRIMNATNTLWVYGEWLLIIFGALYACLWAIKADALSRTLPLVYLVVALAANYAMILSPVYYIRSFYPSMMFLVIGILSCLRGIAKASSRNRDLPLALISGIFAVFLCYDLFVGGYDIASYYRMRTVREQEIVASVEAGETDVKTYAVFPYTRFCSAWGQPDIRMSANNWVNKNMSQHLGADSIAATEQRYYHMPGYDGFTITVEDEMSLALEP